MKERIFLSPPHMGGNEIEFITNALDSNFIAPLGPQVDAFEKEFSKMMGMSYAIALSSGTAAMHLALRQIGASHDDEVFVSTLTFIGSVSPVTFLGSVPVFIDSDRATWNMDTDLLADELSKCHKRGNLPKAVVPTELYGQCVDLDKIIELCSSYAIPVVVDSAESVGSTYKGRPAGSGATAAIYSFNGNKIITTSCGGMLASDDKKFIQRARYLSQQARDPVPYYEHSEIGYNYRMSNILAAIGRGQLKVLNERVIRKRDIFDYYKKSIGDLPGIDLMPESAYGKSNRWLTVILITPEEFGMDREAVRMALETENIESRPVWKPMHMQPVFDIEKKLNKTAFENNKQKLKDLYKARVIGGVVAEDLFARGLCLPSGTAMSENDLDRIVSIIHKCSRR